MISSKNSRIKKFLSILLTVALCIQIVPITVFAQNRSEAEAEPETTVSDTAEFLVNSETQPQEILAEDVSLREENVKHFRMTDGSYTAVQYSSPVHYQTDENTWEEYDNRLSETETLDEDKTEKVVNLFKEKDYVNQSGDYSVRFSKKTNGKKLVRLEKDGYKLSWTYQDMAKKTGDVRNAEADNDPKTVDNLQSEVVYANVYKDTELQYIVSGSTIKENFILHSEEAVSQFTAEYKMTGLTAVSVNPQEIAFRNADGETIFSLYAPCMFDANGATSDSVTLEILESKNNSVTIRTTVDTQWLQEEDRAFPVTVDPAIFTKQTRAAIEGAYVSVKENGQGAGGEAYGEMFYEVGYDSYTKYKTRIYLNINLPTLDKSDIVVAAYLNLYLLDASFYSNSVPDAVLDLHEANSGNWKYNTLTWANQPGYNSLVVDTLTVPNPKGGDVDYKWYTYNVSKSIKKWYTNPASQTGFVIKRDVESFSNTNAAKVWFASEFTPQTTAPRPIIEINYRNNKGLEDYWSYHTQAVGNSVSYINDYTGNLVLVHNDAATTSNLLDASISHVYNGYQAGSHMPKDPQYAVDFTNAMLPRVGLGFRLNAYQSLVPVTSASGLDTSVYKYIYNDADGTIHYFFLDKTTNKIIDEDGLGYTITDGTHGGKRITTKDQTIMDFDATGRLAYIEDITGNTNTFAYTTYENTPYLSKVTDAVGNTILLNQSGGYLSSISYENGTKTIQYTYGATAQAGKLLTKITYPDGTYTTFTYNSDGTLKSAVDSAAAYSLNYSYSSDAAKRVIQVDEKAGNTLGQTLKIQYGGDNTTTFTTSGKDDIINTSDDIQTIYTFNNFGQTISLSEKLVSGAYIGGEMYDYTSAGSSTQNAKASNKLARTSTSMFTTENLLTGGNIDSISGWSNNAVSGVNYSLANSGYIGQHSLQITASQPNSAESYWQVWKMPSWADNEFTFSAYVKTSDLQVHDGGEGVRLCMTYIPEGKTESDRVYMYSEPITTSTGDDWERLYVTGVLPSGATSFSHRLCLGENTTGTVYFDNVMLELNDCVNQYNLLKDPYFSLTSNFGSSSSYWQTNNTSVAPYASRTGAMTWGSALKIEGDINRNIYVWQDANVTGSTEKDTFVLSGFAKADSLPDASENTFRFSIQKVYTDGYSVWEEKVFNNQTSAWQFLSMAISMDDGTATERTPSYIRVCLCYQYQKNTAYFDNIQLVKDDVPAYKYDKNGNLVSASANTQETQTAFTDGDVNKLLTSSGDYMHFSYDGKRLYNARTSSGVQTTLTYQSATGKKPVTLTTRSHPNAENTVEEGIYYTFRNKYSGLFMDAIGAQTVNDTQVGQYTTWYTSNQKWRFVKQSSGNYRIYPRSLSTGWLYYYAGDGLMKITTKGSIAEEFQLVYNSDDGTFSIKNVRNNKYVTLKELNSDKGTRLTLANYDAKSSAQRWYITPVDPPAGDTMTTTATYTQNEAFMTSSTDYRGVKTTYDYNTVDGTLKSVTENANEALNSDSRTTSYTYDSNTKALKSVSLADGDTVFTNTYTYDSAKRLSTIRHNGFDYTFAYDEFGNTKTIKVGNRTLTTNNYNTRNGKLLSSTYGNGDTVQYSYDNYERLAQENRDGDITSYTYNLAGQLTEITDTTGKYTYYYDSIGRVTRMVYPDGGNLKPVYDKDNRLTAVHTNLGGTQRTTGYTYLLDGRLSQTALPTGKTVTYSYDPLARLSGSGIDGVLSSSYTYESPGEGKTTPLVSSVTTNGEETEYTYDAFGNILTITEDGVLQHSYTYDARNQLVGETSGTDSYVYSYDAGGNLVSVQKNGEVIKSYTYGDASWKDLLTAFNGQSITYDAIGNPLSYRGMTLSWAGGRRLASVSKEGLSASYVYNSDGIRTQKTVNGVTTNYYLDGSSVLRQVTGNDVLEFFYDTNGVLGFYYNNTPYYYLKNLQGDIVGILDANGTQVVSYTYDAWGAPLSVTGTAADTIGQLNPFRYRSYYYDNETGLYYLNSRYYDPQTYRFLNADSQLNNDHLGCNLFIYCGNNPVARVDDNGQGWWVVAGAIVGGIIGGVSKAISNIVTGERWNNGIIGAVVGGAVSGGVFAATGSTTLAAFSGAASESLVNQVLSYIPKVSKINGNDNVTSLTTQNVLNSAKTVLNDTVKNGITSAIMSKISGIVVPTNNNWIQPQKFISSFVGNYAIKSELQSLLQGGLSISYAMFMEEFKEGQQAIVNLFSEVKEKLWGSEDE